MPNNDRMTPDEALALLQIGLKVTEYLSFKIIDEAKTQIESSLQLSTADLKDSIYQEARDLLVKQYVMINFNKAASFLELPKNTIPSTKDIKKAYMLLSRKYHPDKGGNADLFTPLSSAYNSLNTTYETIDVKADVNNTETYDKFRSLALGPRYFLAQMMLREFDERFVKESNPEAFVYRLTTLMSILPIDEWESTLERLVKQDQLTKFVPSGTNQENTFVNQLSSALCAMYGKGEKMPVDKFLSLLIRLPVKVQSKLPTDDMSKLIGKGLPNLLKTALENEQHPEPFGSHLSLLISTIPVEELEATFNSPNIQNQLTKFVLTGAEEDLNTFVNELSKAFCLMSQEKLPADKLWSILNQLPPTIQAKLPTVEMREQMPTQLSELLKLALSEMDKQIDPILLRSLTTNEIRQVHQRLQNPVLQINDAAGMLHTLLSKNTNEILKQIQGLPEAFLWSIDKELVQSWGNLVKDYISLPPSSNNEAREFKEALYSNLQNAQNFRAFQEALSQYYKCIKDDKTNLYSKEAEQFKSLMELIAPKGLLDRSTLKQIETLSPDKLSTKKPDIQQIVSNLIATKAEQDKLLAQKAGLHDQLRVALHSSDLVRNYTPEKKTALAQFVVPLIGLDVVKATRIMDLIQQNNIDALQQEEGWPLILAHTAQDEFNDIIRKHSERAPKVVTEAPEPSSSFNTLKMRHEAIVQRSMPLFFTKPHQDAPSRYLVFDKSQTTLVYYSEDQSIDVTIKNRVQCKTLINRFKEVQAELEDKQDIDKVVSIHLDNKQLDDLCKSTNLKEALEIGSSPEHRIG